MAVAALAERRAALERQPHADHAHEVARAPLRPARGSTEGVTPLLTPEARAINRATGKMAMLSEQRLSRDAALGRQFRAGLRARAAAASTVQRVARGTMARLLVASRRNDLLAQLSEVRELGRALESKARAPAHARRGHARGLDAHWLAGGFDADGDVDNGDVHDGDVAVRAFSANGGGGRGGGGGGHGLSLIHI